MPCRRCRPSQTPRFCALSTTQQERCCGRRYQRYVPDETYPDCLNLSLESDGIYQYIFAYANVGNYNGRPYYYLNTGISIDYIFWDNTQWVISDTLGGTANGTRAAESPVGIFTAPTVYDTAATFVCEDCTTLEVTVTVSGPSELTTKFRSSYYLNNRAYYFGNFAGAGVDASIYWDGTRWVLENITGAADLAYLNIDTECPASSDWDSNDVTVLSVVATEVPDA